MDYRNKNCFFSFQVTHDGISVSYDQELLRDIWHAFSRGYKKRFARFKVGPKQKKQILFSVLERFPSRYFPGKSPFGYFCACKHVHPLFSSKRHYFWTCRFLSQLLILLCLRVNKKILIHENNLYNNFSDGILSSFLGKIETAKLLFNPKSLQVSYLPAFCFGLLWSKFSVCLLKCYFVTKAGCMNRHIPVKSAKLLKPGL